MVRAKFLTGMVVVLLAAGLAQTASEPIYDEKADANKQVEAAITEASAGGKNVVLVFGANWCGDCHALDAQMRKPELASLIAKNFVVVHVDVGRMNKNLEVAKKYGVPLTKGIPALAVLDRHGKLLYAQDQGQFEDARHMTYDSFLAFFEQWKPKV